MKTVERLLMKVIVIQLISLILSQLIFYKFDTLSELKPITKYEGVYEGIAGKIAETFYIKK